MEVFTSSKNCGLRSSLAVEEKVLQRKIVKNITADPAGDFVDADDNVTIPMWHSKT